MGEAKPVPWTVKLKGFSSESSLAIERLAVWVPTAEGSKVTANVVCPPAGIGPEGSVVTLKLDPPVPPMSTRGLPVRLSAAVPRFLMVKERRTVPAATSAVPKSV